MSALAVLKMVMHAQSGGRIEVRAAPYRVDGHRACLGVERLDTAALFNAQACCIAAWPPRRPRVASLTEQKHARSLCKRC